MAKKKPNPQDATRRNVQAANRRFSMLKLRVKKLEALIDVHDAQIGWLNRFPWAAHARIPTRREKSG